MNVVFIVPTGIGAEIGGHAGDATPVAKLIASLCDVLFVHPNVVNASDINEMTVNMLYVEGSILDRFLEGQIGLEEVYSNKILLAVNSPVKSETINAVSGARATIGADIEIVELKIPLRMVASMIDKKASGDIYNLDEAIEQVVQYDFDVLVVNTPIEANDEEIKDYLTKDGGTNIWGGVEAKLSKLMSEKLNKPVIHAPVENSEVFKTFNEIIDPRKAAEMVSMCYLHCCLKGGHVAPRISLKNDAYWNTDIDFLVTPVNVFGRPHVACIKANIPVIAVEENRTVLKDKMPNSFIIAKNYLEVAGIISAKKAGIMISSIRRPLEKTNVLLSEEMI
ncbi:hypothetical protein LCGC14_0521290 [marine sediment metagenome]|uniref:DUF3326 domain-containing protein n=1 Tax=marine sediment metagenome TaxID=412755 RepID=A0A0F9S351_9ZZZZ